MFSLRFLKEAAERAIRTFAQGVLAHAAVVGGWDFTGESVEVGLAAALASVLMSVVASGIGEKGSTSVLT